MLFLCYILAHNYNEHSLLEKEMPVKYTVSTNGMFVHAIAHGVLIPDDIHQYIKDISLDDCVKPGFSELFDVHEITESKIIPEIFGNIRQLLLDDPKRKRGGKLAIVVGTKSSFDNAQQYERSLMPDIQNVIVFNDAHIAKIWLGVDDMGSEPATEPDCG